MELCAGCETFAVCPVVGILKDHDEWIALPVCGPCWQDPAHRTKPLKMHFFDRAQEAEALRHAGSVNLG